MHEYPKYVDIHSHVNFHKFEDDRDEVVGRALEKGVWMINASTQRDTSQTAVGLTERYKEGVYAIVGLHPTHTSKSYHDTDELGEGGDEFTSRAEVFDKNFYKGLLDKNKVVGIGECGLDYYRTTPDSIERQCDAFIAQVELAIELDVPLMIHTRSEKRESMKAYEDVLDILESYSKKHGEKLRGNFHFFAGDTTIAKRILEIGFTCSFTGVVTFARDYDDVVKYIPSDMIHAETDSPYIAPVPYRGKRCEPVYVIEVVKALARIREQDEEELRSQLLKNAQKAFGLALK